MAVATHKIVNNFRRLAARVCERDTETGDEVKVVRRLDRKTVSGSVLLPYTHDKIRANVCLAVWCLSLQRSRAQALR